jgi:hypothetical protein
VLEYYRCGEEVCCKMRVRMNFRYVDIERLLVYIRNIKLHEVVR